MIQKFLPILFTVLFFSGAKAQFSGNALDFDGSDDLVNVLTVPAALSSPSTNDFTIEAWVNPRGSAFARIFFAQASTSNFVSLGTNTGNTIYFYVIKNGTTVSVATTATIPQNQWTHVAARWTSSSSVAEVFFNGVLQSSIGGGTSSTGTSGLVTIGSRTGGSQYFNGQLDELRVWGSALNICDIQANMNHTIPTAQANLLMNYTYNEGVAGASNATVTTLPDLSGNAYNGTLVNFALTGTTSNWVSSTASVTASGYSSAAISAVTSQTNILCNGTNNGMASVTASGTGPFTYTWAPSGGNASNASGLSAGVYSVSATNACGTVTKTLTVTEPAALSLSVAATSTALCVGNSATLTASGSGGTGAITYTWTTSIPSATTIVSPAISTVYTVNATDANSCAKSATLDITVNALPIVSLTATANSVCVNSGSIALTGSPAGGVYSGTNVSGTAFTPATTGTFTPAYSYTNASSGCSNTAVTTVVVNLCTGIGVVDGNETAISVYPNPGNGLFTLALTAPARVSIMNVVGSQVLATETLEPGKHSFDLSNEASGIYFIKVTGNGKSSVVKLVKQ